MQEWLRISLCCISLGGCSLFWFLSRKRLPKTDWRAYPGFRLKPSGKDIQSFRLSLSDEEQRTFSLCKWLFSAGAFFAASALVLAAYSVGRIAVTQRIMYLLCPLVLLCQWAELLAEKKQPRLAALFVLMKWILLIAYCVCLFVNLGWRATQL